MGPLIVLAKGESLTLLALLGGAVFVLLLTGSINAVGLFQDKTTGTFDPGRLQLLVLTAVTAILIACHLPTMLATHTLAEPRKELLYTMIVSQGIYLVRKHRQVRRMMGRRSALERTPTNPSGE